MSITYTVIVDGMKDKQITIDSNTTVREAIEKINLCVGEMTSDETENSANTTQLDQNERKVSFSNNDNDADTLHTDEPVEIFGLSAYTDRSTKFNTIKFPKNELIVYPIPLENLFLKSASSLLKPPE